MEPKKQALDTVATPEFDALARPLFARKEQIKATDTDALLTDAAQAGLPDLYVTHLITLLCERHTDPYHSVGYLRRIWSEHYKREKERVDKEAHNEKIRLEEEARHIKMKLAAEAFAVRLRGMHPAEGE